MSLGLRKRAEERAEKTVEATKKIGFIGKLKLVTGIAPRLYEDWQHTDKCFVANNDLPEEKVREAVIGLVAKHTDRDTADLYPCLAIQVVPDTSLTPNSRYGGSTYISTESKGKHPRTHKRTSDFLFDHMSPEFDDLEGKEVWAHISWNRLTEQYGGELDVQGDDARNEWGLIITYIKTKKEAVALAADLTKDTITLDELAAARGYDAAGVRKTQQELKNAPSEKAEPTSALTKIGATTAITYSTLKYFLDVKTVDFLEQNFKTKNGDIVSTAEVCGTNTGDLAIVLNQPQYFKDLMAQTGLSDGEAVVKVAADTGLVEAADLANFLGIEEAPF